MINKMMMMRRRRRRRRRRRVTIPSERKQGKHWLHSSLPCLCCGVC
jgi:hypothetical protein